MSKEVNKGVVAVLPFKTLDKPNGSAVAPDSDPTVKHYFVDGTATDPTGVVTIAQAQDQTPAAITGKYNASVVTANLSINSQVEVVAEATIAGITKEVCLTFTVVDVEAGTPTIVSC